MPRQSRIDAPGALHHVICRGIEGGRVFSDDSDRDDFVFRLGTILSDTSTRCFAWALIPNHFHLLLQTGPTPLSTVMSRLLTGYAATFNRRHDRHGHLFQNRYKSILCQEEPYLLELVRYIHLNPLRAGLVTTMEELAHFPYSGHGPILGHNPPPWMADAEILLRFDKQLIAARKAYVAFVSDGIKQGQRKDLTGGGLLRSTGGWHELRSIRNKDVFRKSDERILGDSVFVDNALDAATECLVRKQKYARMGIDLETLERLVAELTGMDINELRKTGKQPRRVKARSLLSFWAVRELGLTATALAGILSLTQPAVTIAVQRGEKLANENGWRLEHLLGRNL